VIPPEDINTELETVNRLRDEIKAKRNASTRHIRRP
jgi:hypothetical protein